MTEKADEFPLFPLGIVAVPGEIVPLHIFEDRYKTMIGECLERDAEFGIAVQAITGEARLLAQPVSYEIVSTSQAEGMALEASLFGLCAGTEDKDEGTQAFLQKRAAKFKGR